jgi:hypothetical protein
MTTILKAFVFALAAIILAAGFDASPVNAQSWAYEKFERDVRPHRWGQACRERIITRGRAAVKLFSNSDKRKGTVRAIQNWSEQVAAEFGPQFADWRRARGQDVGCTTRGLDVICFASAHPCR